MDTQSVWLRPASQFELMEQERERAADSAGGDHSSGGVEEESEAARTSLAAVAVPPCSRGP